MYRVRPIGRIATSPFSTVFQILRIGVPGMVRAEGVGSEPNIHDKSAPSQFFPITYDPAFRRPPILDAGKCGYTHAQPPHLHFSWRSVRTALPRDRDYLPPEVTRALTRGRIPSTSLSVYVREVGRDEPIVSFNSEVPRNPASTMKVLTTYAALELLGPAYTWRTRAYATTPVSGQVLEGDLWLVGGGDPFMTSERWWSFVNGLRQTGLVAHRGRRRDRQHAVRSAGRGSRRVRQPAVPNLQRPARRAAGQFPDHRAQRRAGSGLAAAYAPRRSRRPRTS